MMNDANCPFSWPESMKKPTASQKVFMGMPIIGIDRRTYSEFRKQQKQRDQECLEVWPADTKLCSTREAISGILMEEMNWPNALFHPHDPCGVLFFDPLPCLDSSRALMKIEDHFDVSLEDVDIEKLTFQEVVGVILEKSNPKGEFEAS